jgi:hypothetical protein
MCENTFVPRLPSGIIDRDVGLFSVEERLISFARHIYVPILYTTVHFHLQRGNGLLHKLHDADIAEPTRTNRKLLRSASQAHQTHSEWAIGRLRAEMPGMAVHMRIAKALVRGAASANTSAIRS